ncbi:hypothetical protein FRC17_009974, partial [Serendipita sp. 399]
LIEPLRFGRFVYDRDVTHDEWDSFTKMVLDIWKERIPAFNQYRGAVEKLRDVLLAWNFAFFEPRGMEVVLFRGDAQWSGPQLGRIEVNIDFASKAGEVSDPDEEIRDGRSKNAARRERTSKRPAEDPISLVRPPFKTLFSATTSRIRNMDVDTLPYDDESGEKYAEEHPQAAFRNRIGAGRLYLFSESSAGLAAKPRQSETNGIGDEEPSTAEMTGLEIEEDIMDRGDNPLGIRDNAILFRGDAIAHLPTKRIFKYASHNTGSIVPLGVEWVNDTNVVVVWKRISEARKAFQSMREAGTLELEEDEEGFLPARPISETLAPVELRLEKALGKNVQQQAQMWMRWARAEDVKEKGGKKKSKFYERYGENAGKDGQNIFASRRREESRGTSEEELRRRLDAELDSFAAGDETASRRSPSPRRDRSASPPRRDQRTSGGRRKRSDYEYDADLRSRIGPHTDPQTGKPIREWDVGKEWDTDEFGRSRFGQADEVVLDTHNAGVRRDGSGHRRERRGEQRSGRREARESRPARTKEELDAELDAFLGA